jgi:anti-repressor protein
MEIKNKILGGRTMNNLITIKNQNGKQRVSAKELYLGLGLSKTEWSRWYQINISNNDYFKENMDWAGFVVTTNGNDSMDFAISIEFAKHIAMMARTEKSHEYRNYFIECEKQLKENKPTCIEDVLIQSLQEMKDIRQQLNEVNHNVLQANNKADETKQEVQDMRDVIALTPNAWRTDCSRIVNEIAQKLGGFEHIRDVREESYKLLDQRMGVSLASRLLNKRKKMALEGVPKSKIDKVNKLDVITDDKKLIEGYLALIKEMAIKYKAA